MPETDGPALLRNAETIEVYARTDGFEVSWLRSGTQDYLRHTCGFENRDPVDALIALSDEQMRALHAIYHERVTSDAERDARFLRILSVLRQASYSLSVGTSTHRYTGHNPDLEAQFADIDGYQPPEPTSPPREVQP